MDESIKQKLYSDGLWVVGLKILAFPVGLALITLLTRMLSAEEMGTYFLISSLVEFLVLFSMLGMERSVVRIVSQALALKLNGRAWQAIRYVLGVGILSATAVAALLLMGAGQFVSEKIFNSILIKELIYYSAIWVILMSIQRLIAESFRGVHDTRFATVFNGSIPNFLSVSVLGMLLLMHIKINLSVTMFIVVSTYGINVLLGLVTLFRNSVGKEGSGTIYVSEILKTSCPLCLSAIFITGLQQGHLWILGYCSNTSSVAIYGAVMRIVILFTATLQIVKLVIPAMVAKLYAQNNIKDLEKMLRSTASIAGIPSIIGLSLVIVFGRTILINLYGENYADGDLILIILGVSSIINIVTGAPGVLLMMSSKEKELLIISVASGSISIVVSMVLVNKFDYLGVAVGAGVGIAMQNLLMAWYCLKAMRINTFISIREFCNLKKIISSIAAGYKRQLALKTDP